jgi:hypothetical protein
MYIDYSFLAAPGVDSRCVPGAIFDWVPPSYPHPKPSNRRHRPERCCRVQERGVLAEQRAGGFLGAAGNICPAIAVAHHASFHELQIFT